MGLFFSSSSFNTAKSCQCFYDKLAGTCGSCQMMNPKRYTGGTFSRYRYHCEKTGGYYTCDSTPCRSLREIDPATVDCVQRYYDFTGRRYFILTVIFETLGFSMDNRMYLEIASLIETIREDATTQVEAIEYDIVGMDIANCIRKDENRLEICNELFNNYIIKIYSLIELNKTNEAISIYKQMVKNLFIHYRNVDNYSEIIDAKNFENKKLMIK